MSPKQVNEIDILALRLNEAVRSESTTTFERTIYWKNQYKQIAHDAINLLKRKEQ